MQLQVWKRGVNLIEHIKTKDYFPISYTIARVLNSGVLMSIEKNEKELKGLKRQLSKLSGKKYVVLFNSDTGALHSALCGLSYGYGDKANLNNLTDSETKFVSWLGIKQDSAVTTTPIKMINIDWNNLKEISAMLANDGTKVIKVNFTDLSFGPCAAICTDDEFVYKRAERLTIFGAFDLRTMWTQVESELNIQPGLQLNYRLSPLVGACVKLSILRRKK